MVGGLSLPELTIDPDESIARRIVWDLVEGDTDPMEVRFLGLDLSIYDSIVLNVRREDSSRFSRTVTPDGSDEELGRVAWQLTDLVEGRHVGEFEFTQGASVFTLPRRFLVDFSVRRSIDGVPDVPIPDPDPAEIQVSVPDDDETRITVCDINVHRAVFIEYTLEKDSGPPYEAGIIRLSHSGTATHIEAERAGVPQPYPTSQVAFTADITGDDLELKITTVSVGDDLKFKYRIEKISLTT